MCKKVNLYETYIKILKEELKPAMGCTEPIALAYASALAREHLGSVPDSVSAQISGSIIKNVKSVIIPNTDQSKGIKAAIAAGIIAGDSKKELEVISEVSKEQITEMKAFMEKDIIKVEHLKSEYPFDLIITLYKGCDYSKVHIVDQHTNVVLIEKNSGIIFEKKPDENSNASVSDKSLLTINEIWDFINHVDINDIKDIIGPQINYNMAIAEEGIRNNYGSNIGKVLLNGRQHDLRTKIKAMTAAASDARMNGCAMPVVINSGSGNQGITVSIPVIVYARENNCSEENLYRALALSNLVAIHQKTSIGTLSAYCGAVSAGAGSGAAIAYLSGGSLKDIEHTIVNSLAITSGIVCDGAKSSCAAKIAVSVDTGILGYDMYKSGQQFCGGDGLVSNDIEGTMKNIGRLGNEGMKATNDEIIDIMLEN